MMEHQDFLPLLEQLKDILFLTEGFYANEENAIHQLIAEIDWIYEGISSHDPNTLERLTLLFAPEGDLQMVALNNGWETIYCELAQMVESAEVSYDYDNEC